MVFSGRAENMTTVRASEMASDTMSSAFRV